MQSMQSSDAALRAMPAPMTDSGILGAGASKSSGCIPINTALSPASGLRLTATCAKSLVLVP